MQFARKIKFGRDNGKGRAKTLDPNQGTAWQEKYLVGISHKTE
jgi:hypothetical protein